MKKKPANTLSKRFAAYRRFVERVPVGMAVMYLPDVDNPETWKVVAANWLATHLVGSSARAFLDGPISANLPASRCITELIRQTIRFGKVKNLGHVAEGEFSQGAFAYWAKVFPVDECCVGFSIEDHSLLRQAREGRTEAEHQSALVSELARAIVWRADPLTLEIHCVSPEGQQILGYWPERWRSEKNFWRQHVHPEDLDRMISHCCGATREYATEECEFRMFSVTGAVLWFRLLVRRTLAPRNGASELLGVMTEITKLKEAERSTQELSRRLIHVQDQEHRRISRELHDSVGQNLAALRMSLHALEQNAALLDEKGRLALRDAISLADGAIQETRTVSYLLHPPVLDELGLIKAIDWYVEGFAKRSGIKVELHAPSGPFRLPAEMELALFRVVQECLTNVHRHSHSASARVRIQAHLSAVLLEISDSGRGIPPKVQAELLQGSGKTGVGLSGIRERINELHGSLEIDSNCHGTTLRVLVPLPTQTEESEHAEVPNGVLSFARAARGKAS
jgi:signal transduction histidine kinase